MSRRKFDWLLSSVGVVLPATLVLAGVLAFWGYSYANNSVRTQLAAQNIFFPPSDSESYSDPAIGPYLSKYAGQQVTNGARAQAFADHYIAAHLDGVADGKTYSEISTLSRQDPENAELAGQVQTLFRGETLRGLLLNAFAFWKLGQLALIAALAFWGIAGIMFVLSALGF